MKSFISILVCICFINNTNAQTHVPKPKNLYGAFSIDSLQAAPFGTWFNKNYEEYKPDSVTILALKKQVVKDMKIQIFMGTWCGDSKREVPRFLKLLNSINFPMSNLQMIGLGDSDSSLYKQSPQGEEKGLGIFRVPVFIISKNGMEVNRINEYPSMSLEKDLLKIMTGQNATPNYRSFALVNQWLNDGTLLDANVSARGLAAQLRSLVSSENELNSLAYLLIAKQKKKEALKIMQANSSLFPESANIASSLGEGYFENGDYANAITYLERALEINKDPQLIKEVLDIWYKAKQKMPTKN
jgi:thiol-disulfide isomerase/thioredoxin